MPRTNSNDTLKVIEHHVRMAERSAKIARLFGFGQRSAAEKAENIQARVEGYSRLTGLIAGEISRNRHDGGSDWRAADTIVEVLRRRDVLREEAILRL